MRRRAVRAQVSSRPDAARYVVRELDGIAAHALPGPLSHAPVHAEATAGVALAMGIIGMDFSALQLLQ